MQPTRRDLGGRAGHEYLVGLGQLLRPDRALDHLDAARPGEADHGLARDAVQETVRRRRVQPALPGEKDVGPGALRHQPPASRASARRHSPGPRLRACSSCRSCRAPPPWRERGRYPAPDGRHLAVLSLMPRVRASGREIGRPLPDRDRDMDGGLLRRHPHHLAAAPRHRPHVGVRIALRGHRLERCPLELLQRIRYLEPERGAGIDQALRMLAKLEDLAAIDALALENATSVMKPVRKDMQTARRATVSGRHRTRQGHPDRRNSS